MLNSPFAGAFGCGASGWNATEWRAAVRAIQTEASKQGLPPIVFGLDSIHGANYVRGAIMLPQQFAMAATFNRSMGYQFGFITGRDTRAAAVPWLFSPILGIATQPLWPRVWETFGEDPLVAAEMGVGVIKGMQAAAPDGEYITRA